ncbi:MAG: transposase [Burkholderiales bacterium]|nr:transposase [Burkholderiales bacterium]
MNEERKPETELHLSTADRLADGFRSLVNIQSAQAVKIRSAPTGRVLDEWAYRRGIRLRFIRPGKPVENAYAESFNGKFRDECLNEHWFTSLNHARALVGQWQQEYNHERPHSSLGDLPPAVFAAQWLADRSRITSNQPADSGSIPY